MTYRSLEFSYILMRDLLDITGTEVDDSWALDRNSSWRFLSRWMTESSFTTMNQWEDGDRSENSSNTLPQGPAPTRPKEIWPSSFFTKVKSLVVGISPISTCLRFCKLSCSRFYLHGQFDTSILICNLPVWNTLIDQLVNFNTTLDSPLIL